MANTKVQQCLVLIKPDGLVKSLTGNIISTLSETKLKIVGAKVVKVDRKLAEAHYADLKANQIRKHGEEKGTQIFEDTMRYIMGEFHTDRVFALVYEGENATEVIRKLVGRTNPEEADPTSIRGKYGRINSKTHVLETVVHASESEKEAKREIQLWFKPAELTEIIYPTKKQKVSEEKIVWE